MLQLITIVVIVLLWSQLCDVQNALPQCPICEVIPRSAVGSLDKNLVANA